MPKYTFECQKCQEKTQKYCPSAAMVFMCSCGGELKRQPPRIIGADVTETVDQYTNVKWKQNQEEMLHERSMDHFYEHEVPRLINEYSLKVCLEEGWLYYDEKGQLQIRKKPPQRD